MKNIEKFRRFIQKIYLNDEIDKAIISIKDDKLICNVFIQHKMFGLDVIMDSNVLNIDIGQIAVVNLDVLYKMVKSFPDDINIEYMERGSRAPQHLKFSNDLITSQFILGKERAIDNFKKLDLSKIKQWLFDFNFTEFLSEYKSYENVLKDYETFYFSNENGTVQLNFGGLTKTSENIITIDLGIKPKKPFKDTILFNKKLFNSVLQANKDSEMRLRVSSKLYEFTCQEDLFVARYYSAKSKNQ